MAKLKSKEYFFSFEGGGWNTVMAKTKRGAEREMRNEYLNKDGSPKNSNLVPIAGSACEVEKNKEAYKYLLMSFY